MNESECLANIAATLNGVAETAERTKRHQALVAETNTLIREAADALLALDSSPHSFAAFKAASEPRA